MSKKKLPLVLLFFLSAISLFRLLTIIFNSSSSSSPSPLVSSYNYKTQAAQFNVCSATDDLTQKEFHLLHSIISRKSPCNLLVFGLTGPQSSTLSKLNAGGQTVFVEDDEQKLHCYHARSKKNNVLVDMTSIYGVKYPTKAGMAYQVLRLARADPRCSTLGISGCPLELVSLLPEVVRCTEWDVVVVDGPSGESAGAAGRMEVIYTAAALARRSSVKGADVVVHDIDRMIEKWFSWEFLCHENLVASKGKLWHFKINIKSRSNSTTFCLNAISSN